MATLNEMQVEVVETPPAEWDLFLLLPNLNPKRPSPFASKHLCICSGADPLVKRIVESAPNKTGLAMLHQYTTWFGKPYLPGCLLVHREAPERCRFDETLRGFRNICALSSVTHAIACRLLGGQWKPLYTDLFVFAAHIATKSGWIGKVDSAVSGMNDDVEKFRGLCNGQIDLPDAFSVDTDELLFKRLVKAWEAHYVNETDPTLLPLFRSLEIAFHAAQFPSDGLTSIHDAGVRVGLWVSAFEVLCHPQTGSVNKRVVHDFLNSIKLSEESMNAQIHEVKHKGTPYKVALLGLIYEDLYNARNSFMHGNPVTGQQLLYRQEAKRPHLLRLAPVVFNLALRASTKAKFALSETDEDDDFFFGALGTIEKAVATALTGSPELD
jgi:hypothetical protein